MILEKEENRSTRRKTLEAQKRSTAGTLSHETSHTRLSFIGERHNALTACAICAPTHVKTPNLFRIDETNLEQCCAAHIVQCCQQYCSALLHLIVG